MEGSVAKGSCPKADKQDYNESLGLSGDQVVEMKVIPNGNSKIVAVGRTDNGYVIISKDSTIEKQFAGRSAEAAIDAIIEQSK
ncbi:MAG: hypothetical protein ACXVCY_03835 [Pseudobdellovibrionaceae bacterium]